MKKAVAMKWVDALRSGKYPQGKPSELKDSEGGYCCLGVLCEITGIKSNDDGTEYPNEAGCKTVGLKIRSAKLLFDAEASLAALNDGAHRVGPIGIDGWSLVSNYDKKRFTFDEIADIIQICWKEL